MYQYFYIFYSSTVPRQQDNEYPAIRFSTRVRALTNRSFEFAIQQFECLLK